MGRPDKQWLRAAFWVLVRHATEVLHLSEVSASWDKALSSLPQRGVL